ncbi:hypothetical protein DXH78_01250 [Undibacter mobilis]|uniref:Cysteine-rich CWC n=1 Tax=Undibacter mobilis TaxID=2292256 RepID=A0A371B7B2_9BRAD|nr:cysteine-rich CWC family protein [Undibacter mobilis]RDV03333.1 hypothetical protein DXH78_01250 [Undibacter mobilis]
MTVTPQPTSARTLTCAACGTTFTCSGDVGCWCAAEPFRLPMPSLEAAADCLCPSCLRAKAARGQNV